MPDLTLCRARSIYLHTVFIQSVHSGWCVHKPCWEWTKYVFRTRIMFIIITSHHVCNLVETSSLPPSERLERLMPTKRVTPSALFVYICDEIREHGPWYFSFISNCLVHKLFRRYTYEFIKQDLMDIPQPGFSFGLCSRVIVPLHAILFSIVLYLYRNYVFFIRFSEGRQVHYGWPSRSGVHGQRLIRIKSLVCQAPTEIYTTGSNHPERWNKIDYINLNKNNKCITYKLP